MMFERIADTENVRSAYEALHKRYFNPKLKRYFFKTGPDGEGFDTLNTNLQENLRTIRERLKEKDFAFGPYFERRVQKAGDEFRLVGCFNLRDKIIYHAIYRVVAPACDHIFSDSLVSYRKGLGSWDSVLKAIRVMRESGSSWVFRTDVRQYAERFDLHILEEKLRKLFQDEPEVLRLFLAFLAQPRIVDGVQRSRELGAPQGADLTTFFYNFYLNDLDHRIVNGGLRYSRYADDIIVWGQSREEAERGKRMITKLVTEMKLELHPAKTFIAAPGGQYDYLGYTFRDSTLVVSEKSLGHLTGWIRRKLRKNLYKTLAERRLSEEGALQFIIRDFQSSKNMQKLISWLRYFQRINEPSQLKAVDKMIRERIGMCLNQRVTRKSYKGASPRKLRELGLYSLVGLYYRMNTGRLLQHDIQEKLGEKRLFSPDI